MPDKPWISGWCGTGTHGKCVGVYAGTDCNCICHKHDEEDRPSD
jgi:hypothetical protein